MKLQNEFVEYLVTDFRSKKTLQPYSEKAAHDVISRLRRIEKVLHADVDEMVLDEEAITVARVKIRNAGTALGGTTSNPYGYNSAMNALLRYREFILGRTRKN